MTGIEVVLLLSVGALTAQVLVLQRHYTEKLSDQALVLNFILETITDKPADDDHMIKMREKLFDSSH